MKVKWSIIKPFGRRGWDYPDTRHLGIVDHNYGPNKEFEWFKTVCGRTGRTMGDYASSPQCKTCLRIGAGR